MIRFCWERLDIPSYTMTDWWSKISLYPLNPPGLYVSKPDNSPLSTNTSGWSHVVWSSRPFWPRGHGTSQSRVLGPFVPPGIYGSPSSLFFSSILRLVRESNRPITSLQASASVNMYLTICLKLLLPMSYGCTLSVLSSSRVSHAPCNYWVLWVPCVWIIGESYCN